MWEGDVHPRDNERKEAVAQTSAPTSMDYVKTMTAYDDKYTKFRGEDQEECMLLAIPLWIISGLIALAIICFSLFDIVSQNSFYALNIINIGTCVVGLIVFWYCWMLIAFNNRINMFIREMKRLEIPIQSMCRCVRNVWHYEKDSTYVKDIHGVKNLFMTEHKWVMLAVVVTVVVLITVYSVFYIRIYSPIEKYCEDKQVAVSDVMTVLESNIMLYVFDLKHGALTTTKRINEEETKRVKETTAKLIGEITEATSPEDKKGSENSPGSKH